MTTIVQLTQNYNSGAWLALAGQIVALPDATASALVTGGGATLANLGAGAGVPVYPGGGYQGQLAGESTADFLKRLEGGAPSPSPAIQGYEGFVTVVHGRAVPDLLVGDKLQG